MANLLVLVVVYFAVLRYGDALPRGIFSNFKLPRTNSAEFVRDNQATAAFDKQGHRGARGLMPENTIPAMLKALDLGMTTLEMDTVITHDGQVILSHEPFFNSEITTKPDGTFFLPAEEKTFNIYAMNYTETQLYDVGLKFHPKFPQQQKMAATKPLLGDVIYAAENYAKVNSLPLPLYNIETKTVKSTDNVFHPIPSVFVEKLMAVINEKGIADRVTVQSFDWRTLQYLHVHFPAVKTSQLMESNDKRSVATHVAELGFVPTVYSPNYAQVSQENIDTVHAMGMQYIPWTINTLENMVKFIDLGVDGIITDYPDLFQQAFAARNKILS